MKSEKDGQIERVQRKQEKENVCDTNRKVMFLTLSDSLS